jgi:NhaP-type Na+/H+ or K+/H+ antiporter
MWVKNVIGYDYATLAPEWMRGDGVNRYTGSVGFEFLRIVAQMLIFGILLGGSFGWLAVAFLRRLYNQRYIEVSVVLTMSYLVFWLGELVMGSSAVLAVVVMGLYVNAHKSAITPGVLHFLHEFYEMIAYILNTVIFMIAGCKLGSLMADTSFQMLYSLGSGSLSMIIAIYPIILFARGVAILVFYPLLRRLGTGCTWKEAVVMWWGGLRGSVGLALGLSIHHTIYDSKMWGEGQVGAWGKKLWEPTLDCRDQPMMVLILTLFVVLTTVVINGVTMAPLMRMLKLTEVPEDRQFMLQRARRRLARKTQKAVEALKTKYGSSLQDVPWAQLGGASLSHCHSAMCQVEDVDRATWLLVLNMERAYYIASFEAGTLGSHAFHVLETAMAEICADASVASTAELGKIYDVHHDELIVQMNTKLNPAVAYEVGLGYIAAQHEVAHLTFHDDGGAALRRVNEEHTDNIENIHEAMKVLRAKAPNAIAAFSKKYAATELLRQQKAMVEHMKHEGELLDLDAAPLTSEIDDEISLHLLGKTKTLAAKAATLVSKYSAAVLPLFDHSEHVNQPSVE